MKILTKTKNQELKFALGLVGLAQVNGRRGINIFKKIELDLYYVANVSFKFDLRIILKSVKVVMTKENVANVDGYMMKEIEDLRVSNGNVEVDFKC